MPLNAFKKLTSEGFLLLNISENDQEKIREIFDAAPSFFQETLDRKLLNRLPEDMGYRPYGVEYSRSPSNPDQVESFSVSARLSTQMTKLYSPSARTLFERMLTAFGIFESSAEAVTKELAKKFSTRQTAEKLKGAFHRWSRLQLNYSCPAVVAAPFINEPHEDGNLVTVSCVTGPGLEVQTIDNEFVQVNQTLGQLLIMPGEITWLLSGGQIRPRYHRVRPYPQMPERMALLFFGDIDPSCCEPWILNEINKDVDIQARVRTSVNRFGLKGFSSE